MRLVLESGSYQSRLTIAARHSEGKKSGTKPVIKRVV